MKWKKAPAEFVGLMDKRMKGFYAVRRTMFGFPCYFTNGYMFTGLFEDKLFMRLSPTDTSSSKGGPFEPVSGRVMKDYAAFAPSVYKNEGWFIKWMTKSYEYTMSLPEKQPKKKKKK